MSDNKFGPPILTPILKEVAWEAWMKKVMHAYASAFQIPVDVMFPKAHGYTMLPDYNMSVEMVNELRAFRVGLIEEDEVEDFDFYFNGDPIYHVLRADPHRGWAETYSGGGVKRIFGVVEAVHKKTGRVIRTDRR